MPRRLLLALALAAGLVAPASAAGYFDVDKLPDPPVTGAELVGALDTFATTFPQRVTGSPNETGAAAFLRDEAAKLGYESQIVAFPPALVTRAVIATKRGTTKPDEHIVFIAHYDTVPQTVTGTYDNGSGTMMLLALAKAFAAIPTNRTVTFAWYNGEEEGTLSSMPHAAQFKADAKQVRAVLGFDMVGIAHPVAQPVPGTTCLCTWFGDGDDALEGLLRHINFSVLGFPDEEGKVQVVGQNDRNSDEASWDVEGFPTLRWAGMRTASSYPGYHMPDDTLAKMDEVAGGRTFVEQGLHNTLLSAYYTALALDNEMPAASATASGSGRVTFDAAGSTDPDGAPSALTWDFGDGKTAIGARVTHRYAKPGRYVARLDVADNLWPAVAASATVPVTVRAQPRPKPKKRVSCRAKARKIKKPKKRRRALKRCARAR
jgi:hypothetical protein